MPHWATGSKFPLRLPGRWETHRWPRSRANDSKTLVQVDLTEISHSPIARAPQAQSGHQVVTALKQKIEALQAELIETKAIANGHRTDSRERRTHQQALAELLKTTSESTGAREKAALLEGKLSMLTQPWRRRLAMLSALPCPRPPRARAVEA